MTQTAAALLAYVSWSLLLLIGLAAVRISLVFAGKRVSNSFTASGDDMDGFGKRLTRAHANCYENIGFAAAVMLYAIATGQTAVTDGLAYVFLGARVAQSLAHLISTNRLFVLIRFAFSVIQILILIYWLLKFFNHI